MKKTLVALLLASAVAHANPYNAISFGLVPDDRVPQEATIIANLDGWVQEALALRHDMDCSLHDAAWQQEEKLKLYYKMNDVILANQPGAGSKYGAWYNMFSHKMQGVVVSAMLVQHPCSNG